MVGRALGVVAVWLVLPALVGLVWLMGAWLTPGCRWRQGLRSWLHRNVAPNGDLTGLPGWVWLGIGVLLALTLFILFSTDDEVRMALVGGTALVVLGVVMFWPATKALWDNDKDAGRYYSSATVFHVPNLDDPPDSMQPLLDRSTGGRPGCDRIGRHDVPSCVKAGDTFSALRWESRTSSLAAARTAMSSAASLVPGVDVMESTLTYQWGAKPNTGQWSAVLDGHGVAQWDGTTNSAQVCRFSGDYLLDRRFDGGGKHSLRNLLAERFPKLHYADNDIWGYCDGERPVIVLPVTREFGRGSRTVRTAGGVIVVKGSSSGRPDLNHRAHLKPGDLPGPVISKFLVRAQREATKWAAGRVAMEQSFGFVPTTFETQKANPGQYLLRGSDKRLYYVSPLVPRGSKSQSFIAYGITAADQADSGRLNRYDVHVLARDDRHIVNLSALHAKAVSFVASGAGGYANFLNSGGRLEQYIPLGGGVWRVYGVQNGQTVFYVDLSATDSFQPKTVTPGSKESAAAPAKPGTDCGKPLDQLNDKQLAQCLGGFADELRRRTGRP